MCFFLPLYDMNSLFISRDRAWKMRSTEFSFITLSLSLSPRSISTSISLFLPIPRLTIVFTRTNNTHHQLKQKRERSERKKRVAKEREEAQKKIHEEPILSPQLTAKNVNNNYSFGKVLGRGATAVVYVANSKSTGK